AIVGGRTPKPQRSGSAGLDSVFARRQRGNHNYRLSRQERVACHAGDQDCLIEWEGTHAGGRKWNSLDGLECESIQSITKSIVTTTKRRESCRITSLWSS